MTTTRNPLARAAGLKVGDEVGVPYRDADPLLPHLRQKDHRGVIVSFKRKQAMVRWMTFGPVPCDYWEPISALYKADSK